MGVVFVDVLHKKKVLFGLYTKLMSIHLFHNNFSPSGTQPEHRKLAHEL